jgi:hypothetical protein
LSDAGGVVVLRISEVPELPVDVVAGALPWLSSQSNE